MEWYVPITILPGIGLMILSTSNLLIALNSEIKELEHAKDILYVTITQKIVQLKRLNYALIGLYIASLLLVLGGVSGELFINKKWMNYIVFAGVLFLAISILLLVLYSIKSLKIRSKHLKI